MGIVRAFGPSILLAGVAFLGTLIAGPTPVARASCGPLEPPSVMLDKVDAAFVGTLIKKPSPIKRRSDFGDPQAKFRYAVEAWVKGGSGEPEVVILSLYGVDDSLPNDVGGRIGLYLTADSRGNLTSGPCLSVDPDVLLAAAAPLPTPDGEGPVALLVGGEFQASGVAALDARGRLLGFGLGSGAAGDISVCPGDRFSVETVLGADGAKAIAVRDLETLKIVRQSETATIDEAFYPERVVCLDEAATSLLAATGGTVIRIDDAIRVLRRHDGSDAALSRSHVAYTFQDEDEPGARREIFIAPVDSSAPIAVAAVAGESLELHEMAFDPSGRRLAITYASHGDDVAQPAVTVVDVADPSVAVMSSPLQDQYGVYTVDWLDDDTLVVAAVDYSTPEDPPNPVAGTVQLIGVPDGTVMATWKPWGLEPALVAGGAVVGHDGFRLSAAPADGGPRTEIGSLGGRITTVTPLSAFDGTSLLVEIGAIAAPVLTPTPTTLPTAEPTAAAVVATTPPTAVPVPDRTTSPGEASPIALLLLVVVGLAAFVGIAAYVIRRRSGRAR